MATVYVSIGYVGAQGVGGTIDVMQGRGIRSETITSSGTSAQGTVRADGDQFAKIFCETAIYAATGEDPAVSATTGVYIEAGKAEYLSLGDNDLVAVIDA